MLIQKRIEKETTEIDKTMKALDPKKEKLEAQRKALAKVNAGGVLNEKELSLFPLHERQKLLVLSMRNKRRKFGL